MVEAARVRGNDRDCQEVAAIRVIVTGKVAVAELVVTSGLLGLLFRGGPTDDDARPGTDIDAVVLA